MVLEMTHAETELTQESNEISKHFEFQSKTILNQSLLGVERLLHKKFNGVFDKQPNSNQARRATISSIHTESVALHQIQKWLLRIKTYASRSCYTKSVVSLSFCIEETKTQELCVGSG